MASWNTADDRSPQTMALSRRHGFGIRSKLFVAFGALAAVPGGGDATAPLRRAVEDMSENLSQLAKTVELRLVVRDARLATDARVRTAHAALVTALAPVVDDAAFRLTMDMEKAGE